MTYEEIMAEIEALSSEKLKEFSAKLTPTKDKIYGVKIPELRRLAKRIAKEGGEEFLAHEKLSFEEKMLHGFTLCYRKSGFEEFCRDIESFADMIDNWAVCDMLSPKVFAKHRGELYEKIKQWTASRETYTVRFGIGMMMEHFLDKDFTPKALELAADIRSKEYYINMMTAWFFATALAKQYEAALPYIENRRLDAWTHNKAIQKSIESRRITDGQKAYLRSLKLK